MFVFGIINWILGILVGTGGTGTSIVIGIRGGHPYIRISGISATLIATILAEFWIFTQAF